jgi:hypothetical protein
MSTYDDFTVDSASSPVNEFPTSDLTTDTQSPDDWRAIPEIEDITPPDVAGVQAVPPDAAMTPVQQAPWPQTPEMAELQEDAEGWFQQNTNFTCGPAAVTQILEDFTGQQFDNELLVAQDAAQLGWLGDRGMPLEAVDDLLTRWGVPSHVESGGPDPYTALQTVDQYIAEGRSVVLFVDSSEYAPVATDGDTYHFTRILDVDMERGVAVLSDSGRPDGQGLEVPLDTLAEAWDEGLENQNAPTYGMVVSDVTDPDGVGSGEPTPPPPVATAPEDRSAIDPGEPFCLLPITMTPDGYEEVVACCGDAGTDAWSGPEVFTEDAVAAPTTTAPQSGPTITIGSENPMATTPTGPQPGPSITIASENPMATIPTGPQPGPVVEIQPEYQPVTPITDVDTATGPFMDDVEQHLRDMRERNAERQPQPDQGYDSGVSIAEVADTLTNAEMEQSGLSPEGYDRTTNPLTNDTGYVREGSTTPSLPPTMNSDRPPGYDPTR